MDLSNEIRDYQLDALDQIGPRPIFRVFAGPKPLSCSAEDEGTVLAELRLPEIWMDKAVNGVKLMRGEWSTRAKDSGAPGYFRIYTSEGKCGIQGTIGAGGDMQLNLEYFVKGLVVVVKNFGIAAGNGSSK